MRRRQVGASGEDFVHEQLGPVALLHSFLVVARDHLADQSQREELHPDHDEQHPEHQQRSLSNSVSERFDHGEIDKDRGSDQAEQEPESAEQMQRSVAVATDERDGQQVEESTQVTLDAIARTAVFAGAVVDGQLRDAKAR